MPNRKLLLVTGLLVLAAALVLIVDRRGTKPDARVGETLLPLTAVPEIDRLEITKGPTSSPLVRDGSGGWHTHEPTGFPADATKVVRLLDDLSRIKIQSLAGTGQAQFADFGLTSPTTLVVYQHGKELTKLQLGNRHKAGGQYVSFGAEEKVYLASQAVDASPDEEAWELKKVLDIGKGEVKTIVFAPPAASGKRAVTLERKQSTDALSVSRLHDAPEGPFAKDPQDAGKDETAQVKDVEQLFANVMYDKRVDASNAEARAAIDGGTGITLIFFDKRLYNLKLGSIGSPKKYYLAVSAEWTGATPDKKAQDATDALNALAKGQIFALAEWQAQRLDKGRDDFIAAAPAAAASAPSKKSAGK